MPTQICDSAQNYLANLQVWGLIVCELRSYGDTKWKGKLFVMLKL